MSLEEGMAQNSFTASRILGVIAGVLIVMLGVSCFFTPIATFGITGWLIALGLIADGASKIVLWNDYRKTGVSDTLALVGGILSIVFGIVMVGSIAARAAVDVFVAVLVSVWLLFAGCVRIARSFKMRKVQTTIDAMLGTRWTLALVTGIIMVVVGIFCVANPIIVMVAIGWQIGFSMVMGGIGLITATA